MNCYDSNLIEGHRTYPVDIEEALLEIKQQPDHKNKDLRSLATDQAKYMRSMFALETFNARAEGYFHRVRFDLKPQTVHLYLHAFRFGEFERMETARITGLRERAARDALSALVNEGFLVSDSPKGKVRIGFPVHALCSLLPNLYPAGDVDFDHERARAIRADLRALRLRRPTQCAEAGCSALSSQ